MINKADIEFVKYCQQLYMKIADRVKGNFNECFYEFFKKFLIRKINAHFKNIILKNEEEGAISLESIGYENLELYLIAEFPFDFIDDSEEYVIYKTRLFRLAKECIFIGEYRNFELFEKIDGWAVWPAVEEYLKEYDREMDTPINELPDERLRLIAEEMIRAVEDVRDGHIKGFCRYDELKEYDDKEEGDVCDEGIEDILSRYSAPSAEDILEDMKGFKFKEEGNELNTPRVFLANNLVAAADYFECGDVRRSIPRIYRSKVLGQFLKNLDKSNEVHKEIYSALIGMPNTLVFYGQSGYGYIYQLSERENCGCFERDLDDVLHDETDLRAVIYLALLELENNQKGEGRLELYDAIPPTA